MTTEVTLKKLGIKHARKAQQVEELRKHGLKRLDLVSGGYTLYFERKYKNSTARDEYTAPTICEAVDKAWEVYGKGVSV